MEIAGRQDLSREAGDRKRKPSSGLANILRLPAEEDDREDLPGDAGGDRITPMTMSIPTKVLPPSRTQLAQAMPRERTSAPATFIGENAGDDASRRFQFRPVRQMVEADRGDIGVDPAPWTRSSCGFVAGAIAQRWRGSSLHNPQHEAAARIYRNASLLGLRADRAERRDTRI